MPDFHNKAGWLTEYGLACGYVEIASTSAATPHYHGIGVRMWKEHGVYHVRTHDHEWGKRLYWESFPTLGQARLAFNAQRRAVGAKRCTRRVPA